MIPNTAASTSQAKAKAQAARLRRATQIVFVISVLSGLQCLQDGTVNMLVMPEMAREFSVPHSPVYLTDLVVGWRVSFSGVLGVLGSFLYGKTVEKKFSAQEQIRIFQRFTLLTSIIASVLTMYMGAECRWPEDLEEQKKLLGVYWANAWVVDATLGFFQPMCSHIVKELFKPSDHAAFAIPGLAMYLAAAGKDPEDKWPVNMLLSNVAVVAFGFLLRGLAAGGQNSLQEAPELWKEQCLLLTQWMVGALATSAHRFLTPNAGRAVCDGLLPHEISDFLLTMGPLVGAVMLLAFTLLFLMQTGIGGMVSLTAPSTQQGLKSQASYVQADSICSYVVGPLLSQEAVRAFTAVRGAGKAPASGPDVEPAGDNEEQNATVRTIRAASCFYLAAAGLNLGWEWRRAALEKERGRRGNGTPGGA
eukprot:g17854.t1